MVHIYGVSLDHHLDWVSLIHHNSIMLVGHLLILSRIRHYGIHLHLQVVQDQGSRLLHLQVGQFQGSRLLLILILNSLGLAHSLHGKQPTDSRKMCVVIGQQEMIEILNMDLEHLIHLLVEIFINTDLTSDLLRSFPVTIKELSIVNNIKPHKKVGLTHHT